MMTPVFNLPKAHALQHATIQFPEVLKSHVFQLTPKQHVHTDNKNITSTYTKKAISVTNARTSRTSVTIFSVPSVCPLESD